MKRGETGFPDYVMYCVKSMFFRVVSIFLTIAAMISFLAIPAYASSETAIVDTSSDALDFNSIFENSYMFYVGKSFYYDKGVKKYCDDNNPSYMFPSQGNCVMVPVITLQKLTGMEYKWSKESETLEMYLNDISLKLRIREDAVSVNGEYKRLNTPAIRNGNKTFVPFIEIMSCFGYNTYSDKKGFAIASLTENLDFDNGNNIYIKEALADLFFDYLFSSGFEVTKPRSFNMVEGRIGAEGWNFSDWGKRTSFIVDSGVINYEHASGTKSIFVDSVDSSFAGFESVQVPFDKSVSAYEVEYKVKASKDYANNRPYLLFLCYNKSKFVASVIKGSSIVNSDDWTTNKYIFSSDIYPEMDMDTFSVVVGTVKTGSADMLPSGCVFYDDIKIKACAPDTPSYHIDLQSNSVGNWYVVGEEAVFTSADTSVISSLSGIEGVIYNSYNEVVDRKFVNSDEIITKGWSWKPDEAGFYEIEFYAVQHDKTYLPITGYYVERGTNHSLEHFGLFEIPRRSLVFTANKTKPMEERNERMYISDKADSPLAVYLADKIGFKGYRIHWIPWGPYGSDNMCIQPEEGVYNWGFMDERMNEIGKYGFDVIGNVLFTPKWASSTPEPSDINGYGMYKYSIYAPEDLSTWEEFLNNLVTRYNDQIKTWEVWNEPHIPGSSTFWNDTPENFVKLLKSAYKTIKNVQPDAVVTIGGLGARRYTPFYKEIMKTDVSDYFDVIAMHGSQLDPWTYNNIAEKAGYESKPYMNTEGHYILLNSTGSPKIDYSETEISFMMLNEYFRDFKNGALATTIFSMFGTSEIESLPWFKGVNISRESSAIFRRKPYLEPRHLTLVLHTLMDIMGQNFTYKAEYELADSQKAVLFENDGEALLALWRSGSCQYEIDASIMDCMTDKTKIIDWEGRTIDKNILTGGTVYYISGLDESKLDKLTKSDNNVIFNEYEKAKENLQVPTATANSLPVFDKKTFKLSDDINWIETDWKWVNAMADKEETYSAKMAVSVDTSGVYLVVDVTDDEFVSNGDDPVNASYQYDSVQFAIDTVGDGVSGDRVEFQVGTTKTGASIFKESAPYIGGNLPDNWSKSNTVLNSKYVRIDNEDGHIVYKIFMPTSELYPYAYTGGKDKLRLSVLVNNNNGDGRLGYLEWSSGIGASKDPSAYGLININ